MKKVEIIKDSCISCGLCIQMNNEVFNYDDNGKSDVVKQIVNDDVINIANMCPTGAIIITE
ncbi:MAG: ferredoxin [Bacilli bacterium]|nr:ferredoxin [Bacilli bacterium]MDD4407286.1 ferredoxin [Bacilli bacterium]